MPRDSQLEHTAEPSAAYVSAGHAMQSKRELSLRVPLLHGVQRDIPLCGAIHPGVHGTQTADPSARLLSVPGGHAML